MSFSLQVTPDLVNVEAGATVPVTILIENKGAQQDRFELEIEGIDGDWKAVPVPVFTVEAAETHSEKFFFKPPRTSESLSGNYPFVVRVRSLESGMQKTFQGVLHVKPFHHLSMEISPKKGFVSPGRKLNTFNVAIVNLGNTDHTVQLVGSDPEDACTYEFEQEQVTVVPGQQREVDVVVSPSSMPFVSSGRLVGFGITGRSIDAPSVVASSQAQLEVRSFLSPASLILALIMIVLVGALIWARPKPPTIQFSVDPRQVTQGESVELTWVASDATTVTINAGSTTVYEGPVLNGKKTWVLSEPGPTTFTAQAAKDGGSSEVSTIVVTVAEKVPTPDPQIIRAEPSSARVRFGQPFTLRYRFNNAVIRAVVLPDGKEIDPKLDQIDLVPPTPGRREYTVVAYNAEGETARKSFTVEAFEESDAVIIAFDSEPETALEEDGGRVTLSWQTSNAVRVELKQGDQDAQQVDPTGRLDVPISAKTAFVLTAFDAQGRTRTKTITVNYKPMPRPPVEDPDEPVLPPIGTTTGGGTR